MPFTTAERRRFLTGALDEERAPRLAPALRAMRLALLPGGWVSHGDLLAAGLAASDVQQGTVNTQIWGLLQAGMIERRGRWSRQADQRRYRLTEAGWPMPDADAP